MTKAHDLGLTGLRGDAGKGAPQPRRATVGRVLYHLGRTMLTLAAGDALTAADVSSVIIYDGADDQPVLPGGLVLGVGLHDPAQAIAVIGQLAAHRACGLILREPVSQDSGVRAAASRAGLLVLGLVPGATWAQLANLLHGLLGGADLDDINHPDTIAGLPAGDLFAVANAISSLLDAPVTIEDRNSRVLAFSGRQDEADDPRIETILGRQVPERYTQLLEQSGVFRRLYRSRDPIFIDLHDPSIWPRAAVAVRAGDEILGSIWAAVREPLPPAREAALRDAANLVALHMLRLRAGADVERRLRAERVATALEGGPNAPAALARLGMSGQPVMVLAMQIRDPQTPEGLDPARREAVRVAATDALALHLCAVHPRAAVALLDGCGYAMVPVLGKASAVEQRVVQAAEQFLERVGRRFCAQIGVGPVADGIDALTRSRRDAERVLRVLQAAAAQPRVAQIGDVHLEVLLSELAALAAAGGYVVSPAITRLRDYDRKHNTEFLPSLQAWLDGLDVIASARALHVHVNTFRYRLRRIAEVAQLDLDDPETRFALMLELRLADRLQPPPAAAPAAGPGT